MYGQFKLNILLVFLCVILTGCNHGDGKFYQTDASTQGSISEADTDMNYVGSDDEAADGSTDTETDEDYHANQTEEVTELIAVHVCGAVMYPDVYYVTPGAIKADVLGMAGGFAEGAATDYVNLAETVGSGEKIYFPYEHELEEGINLSVDTESRESSQPGKVNINTATREELMTLPGIGESKADAIIQYREDYGAFLSIEDITNISGIKEGVYNSIKDFIAVD